MGTRADFYVGIGRDAEWLGSIAWDGYPPGIDDAVLEATTEGIYRVALQEFKASRADWTSPEMGWPWPWNNSGTTDYAYAFHCGHVYVSCFGRDWITCEQDQEYSNAYSAWEDIDDPNDETPEPERPTGTPVDFPDMSDRKNAQYSGPRSGLIVFTSA